MTNDLTQFNGYDRGIGALNISDGAPTRPVELTDGGAARAAAQDADDQLASLHEAGHAVVATTVVTPPFPVSSIDIKKRTPMVELAEGDSNMPTWHTATRAKALISVALGGWAAERTLLEPTSGGDADLASATNQALAYLSNGLYEPGPFISHTVFGNYGQLPLPEWLGDEIAKATIAILADARETAMALCELHSDAITALAKIIYRQRRLTDAAVTEALRSVGLNPMDIRP